MRRKEDSRFITGTGRYLDDIVVDGEVHGVVVRSPHANARIVSIDCDPIRSLPGVLAVFTGRDYVAANMGNLASATALDGLDQTTLQHPPRRALAVNAVRYVGDPVAFVVAETRNQAVDAAEMLMIEYEELPAIVELGRALDPDVPRVWPEFESNRAFRFTKGGEEAVRNAFADAAHVVELELVNNRVAPSPLEPRGAIGVFDADEQSYTLYLSGHNVHNHRSQLADLFGIAQERLTVIAPDVGGSFGNKNPIYPETVLVLWAAREVGRPVKWVCTRSEAFLMDAHGRDHVTKARLALDRDGTFLALRVETIANMGAYLSTNGPIVPTVASYVSMGGNYAIPAIFMQVDGAFTNTTPLDSYRGAGRPESAYLIERLVDVAARDLGFDPADLRRRNFIREFPYRTALGMTVDCGDFGTTFRMATEAAATAGFEERRRAARQRGRLRGIGISSYTEVTLGPPADHAEIRFNDDGTITVIAGTHSTGQGHETVYLQLVNEHLGLPPELVEFVQSDTRHVPSGAGHGGSRTLNIGGGALVRAAREVHAKARVAVAHLLDVEPDDIDFRDGLYTACGTNRSVGILELAARLAQDPELPDTVPRDLSTRSRYEREGFSFPNGCHVAEVEVDPDTGRVVLVAYTVVDDFGRIVNPLLAAGQAQGGIAQGIGQALLEQVVYDQASGQPLTGSFMDYAIPRADDLPPLPVVFNENAPTATNPLGTKGAGEAGATGAPPAVVNAVCNALNIRHIDMPLTPERIWRAAKDAGLGTDLAGCRLTQARL